MIGDVAQEVNDLRAARLAGQSERDNQAAALFSTILNEIENIAKQRKGLKATRIYLGRTEFNTLRAWNSIHQYVHHAVEGDHLLGLPFYVVNLDTHLYVAWE